MKSLYILLFLVSTFSYSQNANYVKADDSAFQKKFGEEIKLRKAILEKIEDKDSQEYKEQSYKLRLSEYHFSQDSEIKLKKIAEAQKILNSLSNPDPVLKTEIGIHYYDALTQAESFEKAFDQLNYIYEYAKAQNTSPKLDEKLAHIYLSMGKAYLHEHDYPKSILFLNKSKNLYSELFGNYSLQTANIYREIAIAYSYTDNFQANLESSEKALEIYEAIQPEDKFLLFQQYANIFTAYKYYGDVNRIKEIHKKITRYYEANKNNKSFLEVKNPDYPNLNPVITVYNYLQVQNAAAFFYTDKAEEAFNNFILSMPKEKAEYNQLELNSIVSFYFETGYMFHRYQDYQNLDNYDKAKEYYFKALEFTKENNFEFGELQAYMILSTLGVDYKQWDDVITYTNLAFKKPGIEKFNEVQTLKHNSAMAYGEMKDYDNLIKILDEQYEFYLNGNSNNYSGLTNILEAGNLYLELYNEEPRKNFMERAYKNFHLSSVIFSRLYRGGEFTTRLNWYQTRINNGLLVSSNELGEHQHEVVERLEINSSDYLWSSFVKNREEPFMESFMTIRMEMDSISTDLNKLVIQLKDKSLDDNQKKGYREKLKSNRKEYANLENNLAQSDNSFYQFSRDDFNLDKVQKSLMDDERIIKYVLTDSSAFAYNISKDSLKLIQLPISPSELKLQVADYLLALKSANPEYFDLSTKMYTYLITPLNLIKGLKLIVVPDSYLANIPFETFGTSNGNYLIQDHKISYAYSLKLLDIQKNTIDKSKNILAAFSPDYNLQYASKSENVDLKNLVRSGNYELRGAKREVNNVNSIFGGDMFTSGSATKLNFLENAHKYDILHLAMHAVVNSEDSDLSNLIFENDERLYLSEFYDLKIPAHMAVLSACDTGAGEIKDGEGVQSLSRAFTYAGVKSTVMSLWPVPDKETSIIMTGFYNNLKSGMTKDEALQKAKINYLKTVSVDELKHPYYWAGFIVSGDVSSLKNSSNMWLYIGIIVVVLLLIFVYLKRKRYI